VAGYVVAAVLWCGAIASGLAAGPSDSRSWYDYHLPAPYQVTDYGLGYGLWFTPPIAFALYPLTLLPWPLFAACWAALQFGALGYLLRRWAFLGILFPPVWWELMAGNVALFMAVAIVIGMRRPAAWALVILLKLTPAVGLLWFVIRREWRSVATALGAAGGIAAITFVFAPGLWRDWWSVIGLNAAASGPGYFTIPIPLTIRLLLAVALITWGAPRDRKWTVAVGAALGTPVLWFNALAILAAVPRLVSPAFGAPRPIRRLTRWS
jgi:hypothetical protein